jgi:hypothetical protein
MLQVAEVITDTPSSRLQVTFSGSREGVLRIRDLRVTSPQHGEWQTFFSVAAVRAAFPELRIPQEEDE